MKNAPRVFFNEIGSFSGGAQAVLVVYLLGWCESGEGSRAPDFKGRSAEILPSHQAGPLFAEWVSW